MLPPGFEKFVSQTCIGYSSDHKVGYYVGTAVVNGREVRVSGKEYKDEKITEWKVVQPAEELPS